MTPHPKALKTALQAHKKVWDSYPVKRDMGESTKDRPAKSMTAALTAYFDTLEKEGLIISNYVTTDGLDYWAASSQDDPEKVIPVTIIRHGAK